MRRATTHHLRHRRHVGVPLAGQHHRRRVRRLRRDPTAACDRLEVGVHGGRGLITICRLLGQRPNDDEVEVVRHVRAKLGRRRRYVPQVLHRDLDRAVARERNLPGQEARTARRPSSRDRRSGRPAPPRLLGRQVLRRADDRTLLRHLARPGSRDPEVGHLDDSLGVDDHVVGLDVAMDDAVAVCVAERRENLTRVGDRDRDRARAARADQLLESAPLDVLHDDEVRAVGLAPVEDRDDVRVREPRCMCRLAAEALDELVVVRVAPVQHLDGHATAQLLVFSEVHVGHAAAAELPRDAIAPCEERSGESVLSRHASHLG